MTNLEYYKDEINGFIKEKSLGSVSCAIKYGFEEFAIKYIENYKNRPCEFVDWLLSEHKEPIKLKQWEKDLLEEIGYIDERFEDSLLLTGMRKRGHFKNAKDISMKIIEILDNCEVVDD